jgi:serine O-acetyltransferase
VDDDALRHLLEEHRSAPPTPPPQRVREWADGLLGLLFPQRSPDRPTSMDEIEQRWQRARRQLGGLLDDMAGGLPAPTDHLVDHFAHQLPGLRAILLEDADAICAGDPAAVDVDEVIRAYPGFCAIATYRVAHHFHTAGVPVIPRVLTEHAHACTGIDIHPGASIGERFCIDHGTGIVVGETTEIGRNVKLYQGVTLGALSVQKEMARTKRHPTVEDDVVIYAGATILGGDTVVGRGSIVGGNVWLLHSVPPHSRIYYAPETVIEEQPRPSP